MDDLDEPFEESEEFKRLDMERQLQVKQLQMESLLEVTKAINNNMSYRSLYSIYKFILTAQLGVDRFLFYIKRDNVWEVGAKVDIEDDDDLEQNLKSELLRYNKTSTLRAGESTCAKYFKTVVPVLHKDIPLAFTLLGNVKLHDKEKLDEKVKFIQTITNIISVAIENKRLVRQEIESEKMQQELKLAAKMQAQLIPDNLPSNERLAIDGIYQPHHSIGGDYYDYIPINNDEAVFCIADISGKGIPAAILMANFQAVLRTLVSERHSMIPLVYKLNSRVAEITKCEKFITLFLARYNFRSRQLTYVNAGHNPSMLIYNGEVELLKEGCTILGMFDELPSISFGEATIKPNSLLLNYTDGLTDTSNTEGQLFDTDLLTDFVQEHKDLHPKNFNNNLINRLLKFKGEKEYDDDISVLTCRFF